MSVNLNASCSIHLVCIFNVTCFALLAKHFPNIKINTNSCSRAFWRLIYMEWQGVIHLYLLFIHTSQILLSRVKTFLLCKLAMATILSYHVVLDLYCVPVLAVYITLKSVPFRMQPPQSSSSVPVFWNVTIFQSLTKSRLLMLCKVTLSRQLLQLYALPLLSVRPCMHALYSFNPFSASEGYTHFSNGFFLSPT